MTNFTEQDIRAIVRDEIRKMIGVDKSLDLEYIPTKKAYRRLGYTSPAALRKAVNDGILRLGKEVQDRKNSDRVYRNYYFNIPACIKRLNIPPEERGA